MSHKVCSFMLADGKELIAQLVSLTGTGYRVKDPLVVHMMRGKDGTPSLAFAQWSMIQKDGEVTLLSTGLLADPVDVIGEVESSYLSNVTGILVPPPATPGSILLG